MYASPVLNPAAERLRSGNAVMGGRGAGPHRVRDFPGPLSIKFMVRGAGVWRTSSGVHIVEDGHFLVVNHGETYSLDIEGGAPRESFCPFFAPGFVEDVARVLTATPDALLDDPTPGAARAAFHSHLHGPERRVVPALHRLRRAIYARRGDDSEVHDRFTELAAALLDHQCRELPRLMARVPAARPATRAECYRRVARALDYLHAHAHEPLTLAELAAQAPLSPYHFHRLFKAIHGRPPLQYLRDLRVSRARRLLRDTPLPVTDVALAVGFESPAAFATRFARATGSTPTRYRQRCAASALAFRKTDKAT